MAEIPDFYADSYTINVNPFGVMLVFSLTPVDAPAGRAQPQTVAVVRTSLEHAKLMTMTITRSLKQYELEHLGNPILIPRNIYAASNVDPESW